MNTRKGDGLKARKARREKNKARKKRGRSLSVRPPPYVPGRTCGEQRVERGREGGRGGAGHRFRSHRIGIASDRASYRIVSYRIASYRRKKSDGGGWWLAKARRGGDGVGLRRGSGKGRKKLKGGGIHVERTEEKEAVAAAMAAGRAGVGETGEARRDTEDGSVAFVAL